MTELELLFNPRDKLVRELKEYAERNDLLKYKSLRKPELIALVEADRKKKANAMLTQVQKDIFLKIIDLYLNGKEYESVFGVNSDKLAKVLEIPEEKITKELLLIEQLGIIEGKPETYWVTPIINKETREFGKTQTINTYNWKITKKGKDFTNALISPKRIRWLK